MAVTGPGWKGSQTREGPISILSDWVQFISVFDTGRVAGLHVEVGWCFETRTMLQEHSFSYHQLASGETSFIMQGEAVGLQLFVWKRTQMNT